MVQEQVMSDDYTADPYDLDGEAALAASPELIPLKRIIDAVSLTKKQLMAKWLSTNPEDIEVREDIFRQIHLVDRVFSNIQNNINS